MSTPYWIVGPAIEVAITSSESQFSVTDLINTEPGQKKTLKHALEYEIDGVVYIIVPLSEICELLKIEITDFMEDEMLDALITIQRRRGYPVVINL